MNTQEILNEIAAALKTDVINSLQAKGSGSEQTLQQITITKTDNSIQLQLPSYLLILEKGRGPTSQNPVSGNPPMIQSIQQWCREKGIDEKAAWAIKKKIDKVGYPAKPGVITEPLGEDNINNRLADPLNQLAEAITTQILNAITI